jgi:hypothetical protein
MARNERGRGCRQCRHQKEIPLHIHPTSRWRFASPQVLVAGILCQKRERYMPKPRAHIRQQGAPIPFQLSFDPSSSPGFFHSRQTGFANRKAMMWARRYASFLLTPALACMRRARKLSRAKLLPRR